MKNKKNINIVESNISLNPEMKAKLLYDKYLYEVSWFLFSLSREQKEKLAKQLVLFEIKKNPLYRFSEKSFYNEVEHYLIKL